MRECSSGIVLLLRVIMDDWVEIWSMTKWINLSLLEITKRFSVMTGRRILGSTHISSVFGGISDAKDTVLLTIFMKP